MIVITSPEKSKNTIKNLQLRFSSPQIRNSEFVLPSVGMKIVCVNLMVPPCFCGKTDNLRLFRNRARSAEGGTSCVHTSLELRKIVLC